MDVFAHDELQPLRCELLGYLSRLVVRPALAEELAQTALLKGLEHRASLPDSAAATRAWLFRVATNLAFDELRRHGTWREQAMDDLRQIAESDPQFVGRSLEMAGTPETKSIAREHLLACFACALRNLPEQRAAALLLREVHGFTPDETAEILECSPAQAKNWLQEARARMRSKYDATCALIRKGGVCHQCVELDGFMRADAGAPLDAGAETFEQRIAIVRDFAGQGWGPWHRMLLALADELR